MLRSLRRLAVARAAALLVALATSGLARAVPPVAIGPHRCTCSAHGANHACACRFCNAAARRAREARLAGLPGCHRAAPRKALAAADPARTQSPCLTASCGSSPWEGAAGAPAERFPLPAVPSVARVEWSIGLEPPAAAVLQLAAVPEVPPPRA